MDQKDLQTSKDNILSLVQISKASDIFKAKPIIMQRKEAGDAQVLAEIRGSLEKCAIGLGIKMDDTQTAIICNDIMEVYYIDSIEDIQQCLKKARQGKYSFGHHKRDCLAMPLISSWMAAYLGDKAQERERIIEERKKVENDTLDNSNDQAKEYFVRWREKIEESMKPQESNVRPFSNSESAWNELIESDPLIKAFFERNK